MNNLVGKYDEPLDQAHNVLKVRCIERALPAGSQDSQVLLGWILDSLGLIRSRPDGNSASDEQSGIQKIMGKCFLYDSTKGWTSDEISNVTGISPTGVHHHLVKLRDCGIISDLNIDGKRSYIVTGGSFYNAAELIKVNALTVAKQRLRVLSESIVESSERMLVDAEKESVPFMLDIVNLGPSNLDQDELQKLAVDLGFGGDRAREGDDLHFDLIRILIDSKRPVEISQLMEKTGGSRARVGRVLDRLRSAGLVERAVVESRLTLDIFTGVTRQFKSRGIDWLLNRGGISRLPESSRVSLTKMLESNSLTIEGLQTCIKPVSISKRRILINTLGGRTPLGYRVTGSTGEEVTRSMIMGLDRVLSRISTISGRLDKVSEKEAQ